MNKREMKLLKMTHGQRAVILLELARINLKKHPLTDEDLDRIIQIHHVEKKGRRKKGGKK